MKQEVVYVKFPLYVQQYLRQRYTKGGADSLEPVVLNKELHPGGVFIYQNLDSNARVQPWTLLSVSRQIFEIHPTIAPPEILPSLPSVDYRKFYLPFSIEPTHYFRGRIIPGDYTAQFHDNDAKVFRKMILDEFWKDFDSFHTQWDLHPELRAGQHNDYLTMLQNYMMSRDINLEYEDAFLRVCNRRKHNLKMGTQSC